MESEEKRRSLKRQIRISKIREKGITLIALVVTIIILLILAGVTISIALSENGIFEKARDAVGKYKEADKSEKGELSDLDKYIDNIGKEDENAKFENNGIDKTHDGAKYDPITTDDGMWIIYKDIDTRTTKVNVYVESKYYCPSFEQFVFEKYWLNYFLYGFALPIYSFSDLSDWFANAVCMKDLYASIIGNLFGIDESFNLLDKGGYIEARYNEMGLGPLFSEILQQLGTNEYDALKEVEKMMENQIFSASEMMPVFTYENLETTYNKLYGDRKDLEIPETEKGDTYKIKLPDGKEEEIEGKDLYKAKFRYVTTKNGSVDIEITKNEETPQKITYDKVNNIGDCIVKGEEYTYTYNCLPYIDFGSLYGSFDIESIMNGNINYNDVEDGLLKCRFNLGGWNVTQSGLVKKLVEKECLYDPQYLEAGILGEIEETCEQTINGEPVTCMVGTYLGRTIKNENALNLIPNTVKYMFDTFRRASFSDDMIELTLPKSVEYGSYVIGPLGQNFVRLHFPKFKLHESSKTGCFEFGDGWNVDELISEGIVEIYK